MLRRTEIKISEDEILLEITTWDSTEIYHELRIDIEMTATEKKSTETLVIGMNDTGTND